jgi:CRP-like cAMP-binding protein
MQNEFLKYISKFVSLTEEEANAIVEDIYIKKFKKGTLLLREGEISKESYFVLRGCVRQFCFLDGEEKTTNFFTEEQWITSTTSFAQNIPANHYFSCLEDSILIVGNEEREKEFYQKFPKLEYLSRVIMGKEIGKYQEMMVTYITDTPEQRYIKILKNRSELIQRVPQHQLASYIGVKPESLSRIRKRIFNKK